jgi:hypothetical protein
MLEIVACIFYRDDLYRQADAAIGVCDQDRLVKRNEIALFSVDK